MKRRGFTLVELLVVIGIIALLISILLPTLGRVQKQARTVKCLSNLRQIGQSLVTYANQHAGVLPYGFWDGIGAGPDGVTGASGSNSSDWATLLIGTTLTKNGVTYGEAYVTNAGLTQQIFACPEAVPWDTVSGRVLHYGSHPRLIPNLDEREPSSPLPVAQRPLMKPFKMSQIRRSSDMAVIWDALQMLTTANEGNSFAISNGIDQDGFYRGGSSEGRTFNFLLRNDTIAMDNAIWTPNKDYVSGPILGAYQIANLRWRHGNNDVINVVFADGHAETFRLRLNRGADLKLRNFYVD